MMMYYIHVDLLQFIILYCLLGLFYALLLILLVNVKRDIIYLV